MEQKFSKLQNEKKREDVRLISNLRDENRGLSALVDALKSEIESLKKQDHFKWKYLVDAETLNPLEWKMEYTQQQGIKI